MEVAVICHPEVVLFYLCHFTLCVCFYQVLPLCNLNKWLFLLLVMLNAPFPVCPEAVSLEKNTIKNYKM